MSSKRILHITSELSPYFNDNPISTSVKTLSLKSYYSGNDVRVFMPRFGTINERRYQLHEVIRLSGINLIVNDLDQPLVIKVASLPGERMQVYFVDNVEFFKRKYVYHDEEGNFFDDNDERAIFFAKSVLDTIKKLNWKPDIIHIHGWMAAFVPLYLKHNYTDDVFFSDSQIVFSIYNHHLNEKFPESTFHKLAFDGIFRENLTFFSSGRIIDLIKESAKYSHILFKGEEILLDELEDFYQQSDQEKIDYRPLNELRDVYQNQPVEVEINS